jgi:hypothetical protein
VFGIIKAPAIFIQEKVAFVFIALEDGCGGGGGRDGVGCRININVLEIRKLPCLF